MVGPADVVIVSLIAIGAVVLVGVLGYWMDQSGEDKSSKPVEQKREGNGL